MPQEKLISDLHELVNRRQICVVVGTGVSVATTGCAPTASWVGLLKSGLQRCEIVGKSQRWIDREIDKLDDAISDEEGSLTDLLSVADVLEQHLKGNSPGEYGRWLEETVGPDALPIHDDSLIKAIDALDAVILTTNYDDLVERVTGRGTANWTNENKVRRVLRSDDNSVIHLHGYWDEPNSIVLGIQDYDQVANHKHTQAVMRSLAVNQSLLFIGCGDGLGDPNFGPFLTWLGKVNRNDHCRNYRLSRDAEKKAHRQQHSGDQRIIVLGYGDHTDLPGFVRELAPTESAKNETKPQTESAEIDAHLQALCDRHGCLEMIGFGAGLQVRLPISEAYVPLRACYFGNGGFDGSGKFDESKIHRAQEVQRDIKLHEIFQCSGGKECRGALILGDPGAGKTTAARQLAYRLAAGEDPPEALGLPTGTLPVFVRLRNLNASEVEQGFETFIDQQIRVKKSENEFIDVGNALRSSGQSLLWIFDGLDEVVDETTRVTVCGWISDMLAGRDNDRFVVTSRYAGYQGKVDLGDEFPLFEVQPLDKLAAGTFIHQWYRLVYGRLALSADKAQTKSESLVAMLDEPSFRIGRLAALRSNPLLLTILCLVYHDDDRLPHSRARLYEKCLNVLLETWRKEVFAATGSGTYDPDAAKQILAYIAWQMHETVDQRWIQRTEMERLVAEKLPQYRNSLGNIQPDEFLRLMLEQSGVLAASGSGNVEFLHLTFQEYLASVFAATHNEATMLSSQLEQSWWHETILLALAQGTQEFSSEFFRLVLKNDPLDENLGFVQRCVNEAVPFEEKPFLDALKSKTPKRQKVKVLRLLSRHDSVGLIDVCQRLAKDKNKPLAGLAKEILDRSGKETKQPVQHVHVGDQLGSYVDQKTGIALVRIPAGKFMMGDGKWDRASPVREVTISQDFFLGKYPVTNEEYSRFLKATDYREPENWGESRFNGPRQPVVGVSWDDAMEFCKWAEMELPSEAQWEYACRAGSNAAYSFGDDKSELGEFAWYDANSGNQTHDVGSKRSNDFGLYDMHGNAWEWCADFMDLEYHKKAPNEDPPGPYRANFLGSDTARVYRGGGWRNDASNCRAGFRGGSHASGRFRALGFRVLCRVSSSRQVSGATGS